ncbi:protein kinase family protein [Cellulosimicrobium sp. 22601]|uniref:protein kinase family protein n=1 Tax=unclassified Cellulosimicrobium TaxID=2624466 RepID=UPI003F845354
MPDEPRSETVPARTDGSRGARLARHAAVSTALSLHSDRRLRELVDAAPRVGAGIGGETSSLDVDGIPVFVKRVRLSDLERRADNVRSTANLFDLPTFCHYGVGTIGAPGFGAWRELAVHVMTTGWVIVGEHEGFPLMHHWRVLPDGGRPLPDELADVERAVEYWGGGTAVRRRIEALRDSSASIVLFLEHVPQTLHDWLGVQVGAGGETAERACALVEDGLRDGIAFMRSRGLLHFDAHFENVLTDGERLYFADFGLAISSGFDLSPEEVDFVAAHQDYDDCYGVTHLVSWLAVALFGCGPEERRALVRSWAQGSPPTDVPAGVAATLVRHAPVAAVVGDFYRAFQRESRATPYPWEAVDRLGRADRGPGRAGAR